MKRYHLTNWCSLALVFCVLHLTGQQIDQAYNEDFVNDPALKGATIGISVLNTTTGKPVFSYNADQRFIPASTQKLITAKTALDILGWDFQYKTKVYTTGEVTNGTLDGDLVILGSGDPTLGSEWKNNTNTNTLLHTILNALQERKIIGIKGDIVILDGIYGSETTPRYWLWEDLSNYYGAGARAMNYRDNAYRIEFKRSETVGEAAEMIRIEPQVPNLSVISEVRIGASTSGDQAYVFGGPYAQTHVVRGTIPAGKSTFTIRGALPDPGLMFSSELSEFLAKNGILSNGYRSEKDASNFELEEDQIILELRSPPLHEIVQRILRKSDNLYAESVLKTLAQNADLNTETDKAARMIQSHWSNELGEFANWSLFDGSGLSPMNRISPNQMTAFLAFQYKQPDIEDWLDLMTPGLVAFNSQGLADYGCLSKIRTKSGSINGVQNYVGYLQTTTGDKLCFTYFISEFSCPRSKIRSLVVQHLNELCANR